MTSLAATIGELVTANRILAHEGIVDSFGHISSLYGQNPQGRKAGRSACCAVDQVPVRHQPANSQAARHRSAADPARASRRGHRVGRRGRNCCLARTVAFGPYATSPSCSLMSVIGGKPDEIFSHRVILILTPGRALGQLPKNLLAGSTVLSAVGTRPPHNGLG